ncbi:unnamed protein product [Prunus brigantina]
MEINRVALGEGLDSEESDARHSAHGETEADGPEPVPEGWTKYGNPCYDKRSQHGEAKKL